MPQISVIIPVYNTELYLGRCIDSILAQTFTNFELILVNDGSTDESGKICDKYKSVDKRIRVIHRENGGVSVARNTGLDIVLGEYIAFVDSDDWLDAEYLSTLYHLAVKYSTDIASCTYVGSDEYETDFEFIKLPKEKNEERFVSLHGEGFEFSKWYSIGAPFCKIIRKTLINEYNLRFDKTLSIGEDLVFYIDVMRHAKKCVAIGRPLYHYYQRNDSAMHELNYRGRYSDVKAWYLTCKMLNSHWNCYDDAVERLIWKAYDFIKYACRKKKKLNKDEEQLLQETFRITKKKRHLLARGVKFEILYWLLEYNIELFCKIA